MSDKTEQPTPKRLRNAHAEGDSPVSSFATQSAAFVAAVAIAPSAIGALASRAGTDLRAAIAVAANPTPAIDVNGASLAASVVVLAAPILAASAVTAAVASVVQSRGVFATKKLAARMENLDPVEGLRRVLSGARLLAVVRAALFSGGVAWIVSEALRSHAADLARATGRLDACGIVAASIAYDVAKRVAAVGLLLATADVIVTRRAWTRKLMMSRHEVKREQKESEGDPELEAARERAHRELLAAATAADVKNATIVVVDPTHTVACALRYAEEDGDEAPVLVASARGDVARKIVQAAREYPLAVWADEALARALVELEVGRAIPEALYDDVAEILRAAWAERT